jgi:hypothetical protein
VLSKILEGQLNTPSIAWEQNLCGREFTALEESKKLLIHYTASEVEETEMGNCVWIHEFGRVSKQLPRKWGLKTSCERYISNKCVYRASTTTYTGRGGTWAGLGRHGPALSCFVPLRVMPSRRGRHVGTCRYDTVNFFFGPSMACGTLARLRVVPAQAQPSKYIC